MDWNCRTRRDGKHTDIDSISLEFVPVESIPVELDDGPVDRISVGSIGDANGVGVEDEADGSLLRVRHELRNLAVKAV